MTGLELISPRLEEALSRKSELTQKEWDALGIHNLSKDHFIKSGESYFKPAAEWGKDDSLENGYFQTKEAQDANLTKPEAMGLRLYTGPAYCALNGSLRNKYYNNGKQDCLPQLPASGDVFNCSNKTITFEELLNKVDSDEQFRKYFKDEAERKKYLFGTTENNKGESTLGLKWHNVGPTKPALGQELDHPLLGFVTGLNWQNVGPTKPAPGQELDHRELREALGHKIVAKKETQFTQQEWDNFGITNLREDHFVKMRPMAGLAQEMCDSYFKPTDLSQALVESTNFNREVWNSFQIANLRIDHFVKIGDNYFKPAEESASLQTRAQRGKYFKVRQCTTGSAVARELRALR